ncbi:MAG: hypothetical protein AAF573_06305 [Bacteroidota bacterium]
MSFLHFFVRDFIQTVKTYREVFQFIIKNKLWKGFAEYSWVSNFMLLIGAIISLRFGGIIGNWVDQTAVQGMSMASVSNLFVETFHEGQELFMMSGFKYVILILLEVVIFHFARKTLEVLSREVAQATLKDFMAAQVRMFKVVIFSYAMETMFSIIAKMLLSTVGLDVLEVVAVFLIQSFFLGFAVVDNYNEIFEMSIKNSFKFTRQYAGVAIGVGVVIYVLMLVPVIGAVLAPLLGAVTATMVMYELNKEDDSMEDFLVAVE